MVKLVQPIVAALAAGFVAYGLGFVLVAFQNPLVIGVVMAVAGLGHAEREWLRR
jgi:hypothetical protein